MKREYESALTRLVADETFGGAKDVESTHVEHGGRSMAWRTGADSHAFDSVRGGSLWY